MVLVMVMGLGMKRKEKGVRRKECRGTFLAFRGKITWRDFACDEGGRVGCSLYILKARRLCRAELKGAS